MLPRMTRSTLSDGAALGSALAGALGLAALSFAPGAVLTQIDLVERLLVLGPMVGIPLGLSLSNHGTVGSRDAGWLRVLARAQPVLALSALVSVLFPAGARAAWVSVPWALYCGAVGLLGAYRAWARFQERGPVLKNPRFALDAALLYLPIGGLWNLLARAGARPLGFDDAIVRLTAVHFHFAGWVAPLFAARVAIALEESSASERTQRIARAVLWTTVLGPGLVGGGITVSQVTGSRVSELVTAVVLASALLTLGALSVRAGRTAMRSRLARGLLWVSSATLGLTMALAVSYAWARVSGAEWPGIPFMVRWHGVANALGYAGLGLTAWAVEDRAK
jgi:hypothetical protein